MVAVLLLFRSPDQMSIVHTNECSWTASLTCMCPTFPMDSSWLLADMYQVPEGAGMRRPHGNVFGLSFGGENDMGTSMCLRGSRSPAAAPRRNMEETSILTCSGTVRKWQMNIRSMLEIRETYRQDLHGYMHHDVVQPGPLSRCGFFPFHSQD